MKFPPCNGSKKRTEVRIIQKLESYYYFATNISKNDASYRIITWQISFHLQVSTLLVEQDLNISPYHPYKFLNININHQLPIDYYHLPLLSFP